MSDGQYITLGYYERDDVASIWEYLQRTGAASKYILWGRSMGAVTSLLYAASLENPEIGRHTVDGSSSSPPRPPKRAIPKESGVDRAMQEIGSILSRATRRRDSILVEKESDDDDPKGDGAKDDEIKGDPEDLSLDLEPLSSASNILTSTDSTSSNRAFSDLNVTSTLPLDHPVGNLLFVCVF